MARATNYDKKIELIQKKIEAKHEQIKALKKTLNELEEEASKEQMQEISKFMREKGLKPADVLEILKEYCK